MRGRLSKAAHGAEAGGDAAVALRPTERRPSVRSRAVGAVAAGAGGAGRPGRRVPGWQEACGGGPRADGPRAGGLRPAPRPDGSLSGPCRAGRPYGLRHHASVAGGPGRVCQCGLCRRPALVQVDCRTHVTRSHVAHVTHRGDGANLGSRKIQNLSNFCWNRVDIYMITNHRTMLWNTSTHRPHLL